ncbi:unnamed protein product [Arctogadus glacialis]
MQSSRREVNSAITDQATAPPPARSPDPAPSAHPASPTLSLSLFGNLQGTSTLTFDNRCCQIGPDWAGNLAQSDQDYVILSGKCRELHPPVGIAGQPAGDREAGVELGWERPARPARPAHHATDKKGEVIREAGRS